MPTLLCMQIHANADVCRFCGSCTMAPCCSLVPTLGHHPPPGITGLLRWGQSKPRQLQRCSQAVTPEHRHKHRLFWTPSLTASHHHSTHLLHIMVGDTSKTSQQQTQNSALCGCQGEKGRGWVRGAVSLGDPWFQSLCAQRSGCGSGDKQGKQVTVTREAGESPGDLGSCWERKAGRGEWDFWWGCRRVWKWVFLNPLFLSCCLRHGTFHVSIVWPPAQHQHPLQWGCTKDTTRRGQNPRDFWFCYRGNGEKHEGSTERTTDSFLPLPAPLAEGWGLWEYCRALLIPPHDLPIPGSPAGGEVSPAAWQSWLQTPLAQLGTSSLLHSISKYCI